MDPVHFIFGDKFECCCQYIIGRAFKTHTPEAMRQAVVELEALSLLLAFTVDAGTDFNIRLSNEILRCHRAADLIEEGKL